MACVSAGPTPLPRLALPPALACALVLVACAAPDAPAGAGDAPGPAGTVAGPGGEPAGRVLVTAHLPAGVGATVYSDDDGSFRFPAPAAGADSFTAWSPGTAARAVARPGGAGIRLTLAANPAAAPSLPGSAWLAGLAQGETRRRFVQDCTACHVWSEAWVRGSGPDARSPEGWEAAVATMIGMVGQGTGFPVVSSWPDPARLGEWLHQGFARGPAPHPWPRVEPLLPAGRVILTEYPLPEPGDLPHDIMVDRDGRVIVTGMFTHRMYVLDPASGAFATVPVPVPQANPRAIDIDREGRWWVLLGAPGRVARHDPASGAWESWDVGMYGHSIRMGPEGRVWFNGHFTVDPELIGALDPGTGEVTTWEVPPLPSSDAPAGESTIPYGLRTAPDGTVWATQLRGGHLIHLDPATGRVRQWRMPTPHAGPRRLDVGPDGAVWIPEYAANRLARFDPESESFREWELPVPQALPYVVRVDQTTGTVWVGTGHGDLVAAFDPASERFTLYPLPTRGALVRHLDVDEERGELWAAYGASPGIPAKIMRLQTR